MKTRNLLVASLMASVALPASQEAFAQSLALEEIVVTARKRDENIYEIPVSVSALSQDQLERAGVDNPEELSAYVAGLQFEGSTATGGRVNPAIRFRGMNQQIITPSTQVGALFWDGSYIGAGGGFLPLGDVERVEVIKGPQTAYFGRNTFTGAVNIIPKLPGDEWEGDISLEYSPSQASEYKIDAGIGGPLTDKVGVRIWAGYEKDGGDFKTQDGTPYAVFKDTSVSGTLVAEPSEDLTLKFTGYYTSADDNGTSIGVDSSIVGSAAGACNQTYTGEYLNVATGERTPFTRDLSALPFTTFCGEYPDGEFLVAPVTVNPIAANTVSFFQSRLLALTNLHPLLDKYSILRQPGGDELGGRNRTYRLQFSGDYALGDHTLSWQASRANTGTVDVRDFRFGIPNIPGQVLILGNNIRLRETYYEARISSSEDQRLRYLLGVSDYSMHYRLGNAPVNATQVATGAGATIDFQNNKTFAIFGSVDYDITDNLTASVELRYTDEESLTLKQGNPGLDCSNPALACEALNEYDDFIPRVILSYTPFDGATTYASYSYSSLLGVATQAGFVSSVVPNVIPPNQVDVIGEFTAPQENEQWELGWKQQGDGWAFTLAAFYADWKNQPLASVVLLPAGGTTSFRAAGDSDYLGFDLEFTAAPTDWLTLEGTVAYVDGEMTSFSSRGSNESVVLGSGSLSVVNDGNKPRNIPSWTTSLSPTILGEVGDRQWFIRTDFLYRGAVWADYSEFNRQGSQFLINARAGIDLFDNSRIEIYGKNLTQDKTLGLNGGTTSGPGGNRKVFNEPYQRREFGVRLTANF